MKDSGEYFPVVLFIMLTGDSVNEIVRCDTIQMKNMSCAFLWCWLLSICSSRWLKASNSSMNIQNIATE